MKGYIYKLWSSQTNDIYIGSTKEKYLSSRFSKHRANYKMWLNKLGNYNSSYKIIEFSDCKIECLEVFEFEYIVQLRAKEGEYIRKLDCVNINNPCSNTKEYNQIYRDTHKEKVTITNKIYRDTHKEKISQQAKKKYREKINALVLN